MANKERDVPEYLQVDEKNKKVKFVRGSKFEEVPYPVTMEPNSSHRILFKIIYNVLLLHN